MFPTHLIKFLFAFMISAPAHLNAQDVAPDARILLIDFGYYSGIKSKVARERAIADLLADIDMFQSVLPANGDTVILGPSGANNIRQVLWVGPGQSVSQALSASPAFRPVERGSALTSRLIDLNDVRPAIQDAISVLGLTRRKRSGALSILDIHVFAPGWRISSRNQTQDLMGTNQATECVIGRGPNVQRWPEYVEARFEFRMPEGVEVPSHSATSAFVGSVTGHSTEQPFILNRGATGPLCALDTPDWPSRHNAPPSSERMAGAGSWAARRLPTARTCPSVWKW